MSRTIFAVVVIVVLAAASYRVVAQQPPSSTEHGLSIAGCQIPKSYGRLVTITAGNNNGLAGQAVFEAEDGTIRWVPFMFSSTEVIQQKPSRRPSTIFPILPIYECAVGHVWQRP